ncbi:DUF262 domain-containing protein [Campylobacter felis]|uniref:DUF262 domain-containing protein n=1 Tax=Campylobacter felis TaxID=2974565 RepID=UPI002560BB41|nr:DUF262 domain-containing protein [Campylobacter felis]
MSNNIKTIKELLLIGSNDKINYRIPSYQRGYKWKKQQVEALLNDLYEFALQKKAKFYCLQPIMVQKVDDKYKVIDGQQRLTTLYLICKVLDLGIKCTIEYETRGDSTEFLKTLGRENEGSSDNATFKGMDYYFMQNAYNTIEKWFDNNSKKEAIKRLLLADEKYVGVIWYESKEDETDLFANVNSGKIPLNDAELIKAQLLLKDEANEIQELRQIEITKEWDSMEYALQDDEFFSFLVEDKESYDTRILLLFEVYYEIYSDSEKDKSHAVFEFIQDKLTDSKVDSKENPKECFWQEIKKIFLTLKSWYKNSQLYHLIGFLLTQNESLAGLYNLAKKQTKSEFIEKTIKEKITGKITDKKSGDEFQKAVSSLQYGDDSSKLKSILLLFNMLSYIDSQLRFSFDIYKDKKWELEHIHAQQDEAKNIKSTNKAKEWLQIAKQILNNAKDIANIQNAEQSDKESSPKIKAIPQTLEKVLNLLNKVENKKEKNEKLDDSEAKDFEKCVNDVFEIFKGEELHTIGNLTLLGKSENISLSNAVFAMKQQRIKELEQQGKFIPLCTRNVFLKYYTKEQNISQALFWSKQDSKDYQQAIIDKIQEYLFPKKS